MREIFTIDYNRDVFTQKEAEDFANEIGGEVRPCYWTDGFKVNPQTEDGEFIGFLVTNGHGDVFPEY